jgi:hypothetical protein
MIKTKTKNKKQLAALIEFSWIWRAECAHMCAEHSPSVYTHGGGVQGYRGTLRE